MKLTAPASPESEPQTDGSLKPAVIVVLMMLAILHLLFIEIQPAAPIRRIASRSISLNQLQVQRNTVFQGVANGGNLALHFDGFSTNTFADGLLMSQFFFNANFALYPQRVFVGRNDRVINSASDLATADVLPDDGWLKAHDVRAVLYLRNLGQGNIDIRVRPIR